MPKNNRNSEILHFFHDFPPLEIGAKLVGYAELMWRYQLIVPVPEHLCGVGTKHSKYKVGRWNMFAPLHSPEDTLQGHLKFALKYEGVDLAILKELFERIVPDDIEYIVQSRSTGAYSRRIWFLYEWLLDIRLRLDDATQGSYVPIVNDKVQYAGPSRYSKRHRVQNNLPGTREFCPVIRRTKKLDQFISMNLSQVAINCVGNTHSDLLSRAAAFLSLKEARETYAIEGESPPPNRLLRWSKFIGQAGERELSVEEIEYLQSVVISESRFLTLGIRIENGFVGHHDRTTGMPIPVHISGRAKDLESLLSGLIATYRRLGESQFDAVLMAAIISFGFVFIHPLEDGNGRIHRYLINHILAEKGFVPQELVLPVSAVILDRIDEYRKVLEHYSEPRLNLIEWRLTDRGNVDVLNETVDLYRYFDATKHAEFLFGCVEQTINRTLPDEVEYLKKYDSLNDFIKKYIDMPDRMVDLLIRFLHQNGGKFSSRALKKEFAQLTTEEVQAIENRYDQTFNLQD